MVCTWIGSKLEKASSDAIKGLTGSGSGAAFKDSKGMSYKRELDMKEHL